MAYGHRSPVDVARSNQRRKETIARNKRNEARQEIERVEREKRYQLFEVEFKPYEKIREEAMAAIRGEPRYLEASAIVLEADVRCEKLWNSYREKRMELAKKYGV